MPGSLSQHARLLKETPAGRNLSTNSNYTTAKTSIQSAASDGHEHSVTFGKDASGNITTSPITPGGTSSGGVNSSWPGAFADLHNHPDNNAPYAGDLYGLITINNNHSGYDTWFAVTLNGTV